jgi:mandelate racemase
VSSTGITSTGGESLPVITSVTARTLVVPLRQPLRTASGVVQSAPLLLIDVETDAGVTGRAYLFTYTPKVLGASAHLVTSLSELLVGQAIAPQRLSLHLQSQFRLLGTAGLLDMVLATIDTALWDALARFTGQPLIHLLGGQVGANGGRLLCYASYGMDSLQETLRNVGEAVEQGFLAIKIKIGHPTLAQDLQIVRGAQRALNGRAALLVDYNQSLSVPEAVIRCRALDDEGLTWIEEPTRFDDHQGHAHIAASIHTPLQLGENLWGARQIANSLEARASDCMMPDLARVGGVTGWLQASGVCAARQVPVSNHFYQEVSIHLLQATPTAHMLEYFPMADPILQQPLHQEDGYAVSPDRPGHGMEWDEHAVERYRVNLN